jgi:hypothetical protein
VIAPFQLLLDLEHELGVAPQIEETPVGLTERDKEGAFCAESREGGVAFGPSPRPSAPPRRVETSPGCAARSR